MDSNNIKYFRKNPTAVFLIFLMTGLMIAPLGGYSAEAANADHYVPGQLYVKYAPGAAKTAGGTSADTLLETFGATESEQAFPTSEKRNGSVRGKISAQAAGKLESLSRIKRISFSDDLDMEYVARKLSAHPGIEYAEPVYYQHLDVLPNDPFFHPDSVSAGLDVEQEYLNFINAPGAWEVATGDSAVVIAIVDSGTDWNHPDLHANVWINPGEAEFPDDGIDNDGNGYIDDVHGWDFYGSYIDRVVYGDNDPSGVGEPHGTHTAGIAAAVTNNGIGVASLSHNVRYMPVKVGSDSGANLRFGYEGILYAAENGAHVINCSWGALYYSNTSKEVTETAIALGAIIVGSAGNNNSDDDYYPVGYSNVFGVGSVNTDGTKSSFSNYGSYVDVSAPGFVIYSTLFDGNYGNMSGTSMAAPIVSALAALIKSNHPDWDSDQILAQIAGTSIPFSDDQNGYLRGTGYINAEAAMGKPVLYIEVADYTFSDAKHGNNDGLFTVDERIDVSITLRNCGEFVNNLGFNIYSTTGYSSPSTDSKTVGSLDHSEEIIIDDISFVVSGGIPVDAKEYIRMDFEADESVNFEVIDFSANPSYATMSANTIEVSFDGNGHIGYVNYSTNSKGMPFIVRNDTTSRESVFNVPLLFEGGLLFGTGKDRVSNSVRGDDQMDAEKDFSTLSDIIIENAPDGSQQQGTIVFSDQDAGDASNNVTVTLDIYSYNETGHDQYVIFSYNFKNNGAEVLENFIPGLFLDFDVPEASASNDYAFYSKENDIVVFTEDTDDMGDNIFLGVTVAGSIGSPWIIQNASVDSVLFGIYDGFNDDEKWLSLSSEKRDDNLEGHGDVSTVVSSEAFDIMPGEEKQVIFIIGYGFGLAELNAQIDNARLKSEIIAVAVEEPELSSLPGEFSIKPVYPNPFNGRTNVSYYVPSGSELTATVYDILGRKVETVFTGFETSGEHSFVLNGENLSSGIYFLSIKNRIGNACVQKIYCAEIIWLSKYRSFLLSFSIRNYSNIIDQ
ncbi:S8 family serine peptidase [Candidatus Latescibacterota bacterium]